MYCDSRYWISFDLANGKDKYAETVWLDGHIVDNIPQKDDIFDLTKIQIETLDKSYIRYPLRNTQQNINYNINKTRDIILSTYPIIWKIYG